jgi:hypothetical protein
MKKLSLLIASFLLPLGALGAPLPDRLPEAGTYTLQSYKLSYILRSETVYAFTSEGAERLQTLRDQGQACTHTQRGIYRCLAHENELGREGEILDSVNQSLAKEVVNISAARGRPELRNEAEAFVEYFIPQSVSAFGREYRGYRYWLVKDLHKMTLGEPAETGFLLGMNSVLTFVGQFSRTESREVYRIYGVEAEFRK